MLQITALKPGRTEDHANPVAVAMQDEIWLGFKYFSDRYSCILGTAGLAIFKKNGHCLPALNVNVEVSATYICLPC